MLNIAKMLKWPSIYISVFEFAKKKLLYSTKNSLHYHAVNTFHSNDNIRRCALYYAFDVDNSEITLTSDRSIVFETGAQSTRIMWYMLFITVPEFIVSNVVMAARE